MPTLTKDDRRPDIRLPEIDLKKVELPDIDLRKLELPKVDLSSIEVPKVDLGKAVADAAIAVGLAKPRRSRWPYVVAAGVIVALAGWAVMNSELIRERISRTRSWIMDRSGSIETDEFDREPVAFTATPTAPLDQPSIDSVSGEIGSDYPDGLGDADQPLGTNGRKVGAATR